jgi:uncharacterized membrane protein YhhN
MNEKEKLIKAFNKLKASMLTFEKAIHKAETAGLWVEAGFDFGTLGDALEAIAEDADILDDVDCELHLDEDE